MFAGCMQGMAKILVPICMAEGLAGPTSSLVIFNIYLNHLLSNPSFDILKSVS